MTDRTLRDHYVRYGRDEGRIYKLELPDKFEPSEYKRLHLDLQHMTDIEASVHYTQHGRYEGRMFRENEWVPCLDRPPKPTIPCVPQRVPPLLRSKFYVVITSIKGYDVALNYIVDSLPQEWKSKYIVVFQKENEDAYTVFEDGHIEVRLQRNIYEYGAWIGIHMLMEKNVLPNDAWCLFVHDTCRFGPNSRRLTQDILRTYTPRKNDCIWLCQHGLRNICLVRRNMIYEGYKLYKNIYTMTKHEAIEGEINHTSKYSPKSVRVNHHFLPFHLAPYEKKEIRKVYGEHERHVDYFESIDLEKYVYWVHPNASHVHKP